MENTISKSSYVTLADQLLVHKEGGELAVVNLRLKTWVAFSPVAARIWDLLGELNKVSDILNILLTEDEVSPDLCERDLFAFLQDLAQAGLVEITSETIACAAEIESSPSRSSVLQPMTSGLPDGSRHHD